MRLNYVGISAGRGARHAGKRTAKARLKVVHTIPPSSLPGVVCGEWGRTKKACKMHLGPNVMKSKVILGIMQMHSGLALGIHVSVYKCYELFKSF